MIEAPGFASRATSAMTAAGSSTWARTPTHKIRSKDRGRRSEPRKPPLINSTSPHRSAGIFLRARSSILLETSSSVRCFERGSRGTESEPSPHPISKMRSTVKCSVNCWTVSTRIWMSYCLGQRYLSVTSNRDFTCSIFVVVVIAVSVIFSLALRSLSAGFPKVCELPKVCDLAIAGAVAGLSPDTFSADKTPNLLSSKIGDCGAVIDLWDVGEISRNKSVHQADGADNVRLPNQTYDALAQHKQRVIATDIIRPAVLDQSGPQSIR